jgi:hypothetical protein
MIAIGTNTDARRYGPAASCADYQALGLLAASGKLDDQGNYDQGRDQF